MAEKEKFWRKVTAGIVAGVVVLIIEEIITGGWFLFGFLKVAKAIGGFLSYPVPLQLWAVVLLPIIGAGAVIGWKALARWHRPTSAHIEGSESKLRPDMLHFITYYDPPKIKREELSTIKLEFTNTFTSTLVLKSYRFFGYREGQQITDYNVRSWDKKIPPGEAFHEWGPADPLKEWFYESKIHGKYKTKIEITYIVLDGDESERKAVGTAELIVSAGR